MRRPLSALRVLRVYFLIKKAWRGCNPQDFELKLLDLRKNIKSLSTSEITFFKPWIARFAHYVHPEVACVVASGAAFVLAPAPTKFSLGVKRHEDKLFSHAIAEWDGGIMNLDTESTYEVLWEITS